MLAALDQVPATTGEEGVGLGTEDAVVGIEALGGGAVELGAGVGVAEGLLDAPPHPVSAVPERAQTPSTAATRTRPAVSRGPALLPLMPSPEAARPLIVSGSQSQPSAAIVSFTHRQESPAPPVKPARMLARGAPALGGRPAQWAGRPRLTDAR